MLNTPITPPRVPLIDPRTNLIDRAWYMFFLSLNNAAIAAYNNEDVGPSPESLIASYDAVLQALAQEVGTQPPAIDYSEDIAKIKNESNLQPSAETGELQAQIDDVRQTLELLPKTSLGTLSAVNIDWVPYLGFDTAPSWIGTTPGQFWFDSTTGSFNAKMGNNNITQQIGEEFFVYGKASSAISDTNLQLVYKTGTVGASGVITFAPTVAGITDPSMFVGCATEPIPTNTFGRVAQFGYVHGVNTTGSVYGEVWADNDDIWYNPVTGGLTKTKPVAPNIKFQVGVVVNAGPGGSGTFKMDMVAGSTLGGTDSNVQFGTLVANDLIQYNGTYWTNVAYSSVTVGTATNLAGGAANKIPYQTGSGATTFMTAPTVDNTFLTWTSGGGFAWALNPLGTVTSVSVVSANGFAGTVATATTTPAITLSTSVTGLLKGNGTAISAAAAGTDYTTPTGTENLSNKTITTSSLDSTPVGASSASTGSFTTLLTSGLVSFGAAAVTTGYRLRISGTSTGAVSTLGQQINPTVQSDVTSSYIGYESRPGTVNSSFTLGSIAHFSASPTTFGASSTVTNQYGFYAQSNITGATNNYGFYGNIASGTGRYNFYAAGTAQNLFSGDVLVFGAGGLGYTTGSGGAVTQGTSRTTGVTLNKTNGAITLFTAAGSIVATTFTVTNSTVAATDVIHVCQKSGTNLYNILVTAVAAGSFNITFYTTGGIASDAPVFNFAVIKAVAA